MDDFAGSHPADVVKHGSEWFVDAAAAPILVIEASERNVKVLGLEGFLIDETGIYPALSRIADFSNDTPEEANRIIHSHRKVRYGKVKLLFPRDAVKFHRNLPRSPDSQLTLSVRRNRVLAM